MQKFRKQFSYYRRPISYYLSLLQEDRPLTLDEALMLEEALARDIDRGRFLIIEKLDGWVEVRPPSRIGRHSVYKYSRPKYIYVPADVGPEHFRNGLYLPYVAETEGNYNIILMTNGDTKTFTTYEYVDFWGQKYALKIIRNHFIYQYKDKITLLVENINGHWATVYRVEYAESPENANAEFASLLEDDIKRGLVFVCGSGEGTLISFQKKYMEMFLDEYGY